METYTKALSEVDIILKDIPEKISSKIPDNFKKLINEGKDKNYNPKINDLVIEEKLLPETVIILGLIYRDFLCSKEEKEKLCNEEKEKLLKLEKDYKKINLDYNDLFSKYKKEAKESTQLIKTNKKWYQKILEYFKIKKR